MEVRCPLCHCWDARKVGMRANIGGPASHLYACRVCGAEWARTLIRTSEGDRRWETEVTKEPL